MGEVTMSDFIKASESQKAAKAKFMVVFVQNKGGYPEAIINPKENFEIKMAYYKSAYNEDLTLKANTDIKIIDFEYLKEINTVKF